MIDKILKNRELRAKRQKDLLAIHKKPLISVTVNIPGNKKLSDEAVFIYNVMTGCLKKRVDEDLDELFFLKADTGIEGIYATNLNSKEIKAITMDLEDNEVLGRFIDFDVIDESGVILSRKDFNQNPRKCYICQKKAVLCARGRVHEINELLKYIKFCVKSYRHMGYLSNLASKSLKVEVDLTPKPGLVDLRDNGSHKDMDRFTFYASIEAISEYFLKFLSIGFLHEENLFDRLREMGKECEKAMFKSTKGVNTHKGIIFSFAVILGSMGLLLRKRESLQEENLSNTIKATCKDLVTKDLFSKNVYESAGERYFAKTNNGGIREEAQSGYRNIFAFSLPFYRENREKFSEEKALKLTLLKLISEIEDTTLYNRGGLKGLNFAKKEAKLVLHELSEEKLVYLNQLFIKNNLSPGGSADMLALTWFLDNVFKFKG